MAGEHGVGILKASAFEEQNREEAVLRRRLKQALDPRSLLNPGKSV